MNIFDIYAENIAAAASKFKRVMSQC